MERRRRRGGGKRKLRKSEKLTQLDPNLTLVKKRSVPDYHRKVSCGTMALRTQVLSPFVYSIIPLLPYAQFPYKLIICLQIRIPTPYLLILSDIK
jgi:hypothetical protein